MFVEWLVEAYYLRAFLQLSHIPHFTTLQKSADRVNSMLLEKIISSFIILTRTRHIVAGIDSTGFKVTHMHHNTIPRDLIPEIYIPNYR